MACTCNEVYIGGQPTGSFNIADDCPEHGSGTEYFRAYCERVNAELKVLYARAREARERAAGGRD